MRNNISKNSYFEFLFFITALVFCTPILCKTFIILLVVLLMWIYILINLKKLTKRQNENLTIYIFLYITIAFGYRLIGFSDAAWGNYLFQLSFFSCVLLMPLSIKWNNYHKFFLWAIFVVIVFNIVDNIRLSYLYPSINVGRYYVDEDFLSSINAGGPSFFMFLLFVFNICFFVYLNCKNKRFRIPMLICCVLAAVYILGFSLKGITVLFFLLSVITIYYAKHSKNISSFIFLFVSLFLIVFVLFPLFSDSIIKLIKEISPNERLTVRLVTIVNDEDIDANTRTVTGRTNLYLISIRTWISNIQNFFFGIGDHRVLFGAAKTGISQHSDLLDILAIYGLLGLILICLIFKYAFRKIVSVFDRQYKLQVYSILMLFIMYGLVEKIFHPMGGIVLFLLLPLSAGFVNENHQKQVS